MSEWYYKAFGEEHGPVTFERLREMASKHQLAPQDRVRTAESSDWIEARQVDQLFPHLQRGNAEPLTSAEELEELDFESLQVVSQERLPELSSLEELDIQVSDAPTLSRNSARPSDSYGSGWGSADEEPPATEESEQWICQVLGMQLGPMPMEDLRLLARKGEISLDDEVRQVDETEWRLAKTVPGLFPGFDYDPNQDLPEIASSIHPNVVNNPTPDQAAPAENLPMLGDDLSAAINDLPSAEIPAAPTPPETSPEPAAASPVAETPAPKPAAKPVPPKEKKRVDLDKWLSDAVPTPEPAPAPDPETAPPQPVAGSNMNSSPADRMARLQAEFESQTARRAAFTPPPAAKKQKSAGPGIGEQFSDLMGKLKENPKILGVFAVLALVLLIKYVPWSFGAEDQTYLDQITQFGNKYKELRTKKASPGEFDQLKKEALPALKTLEEELGKKAGIRDRPKQEMYWATQKLQQMLVEPAKAEPSEAEKTYDGHIATATALIQGKPLPTPLEDGDEGEDETPDSE